MSSDFGASILPVGLEPESETRFRAHLDSCGACEALALEFERLDSLLSSEPVPLPPVDLTALILREVAARRRAELVWARSRLVAAAALVLTVGAIALLVGFDAPWGSGEWDLSLHAWDEVQLLLSRGRGQFDVLVGGTAPPSGLDSSLGPLLALGPVLLLLNWAVGRGSLQGTVT
ncbi:MAG: hypothetical protein JKY65_02445 [Planctomycetes bacterium]|nr:hypothetical protein [Planctomycetota bacterium]